MARPHARKPLASLTIRLSGGRRLRLTLRPRPRISRALLVLLGSALGWPAHALDGAALPQGGQVAAGQATISQSGAHMTIRQGSDKAVLNWQSFNIGSQAKVEFQQPSSNSVVLNRVVGNQASQIYGQLQANGQVFISNPNGVVFAPGSQVNVGGLVATTLGLGDQDFMQGRYQLAGDSQAEVSNAGQLTSGGSVALVAATVRNSGSIQAGGDVALAAGQRVSLDLHGDGLLSLNVEASALRGQVENGAAIQAGNRVLLTAAAAEDLIGSVVNNSGIVKASGLSVAGGKISLSGGLIAQTGTLDASGVAGGQVDIRAYTLQDAGQTLAEGSGGQGGSVRVEAQQITQTSRAHISVDGQAGGGRIHLQGGRGDEGKLYSSSTLTAQGLGDSAKGGEISVTASSTQLRAAQLDASGQAGGGSIQVGGGWQGQDASVANARETGVNDSTRLSADAGQTGDGGTVVVWSDEQTTFAGHISATGGSLSGNGGQLEVSGKENLTFAGTVNTASPFGLGGSLLLDPKNIVISDAAALFDVLNLDDPNAGSMNWFGYFAEEVAGGNIAITASRTDIGGMANVGAAYLFDGESGALLSALYGSVENDQVGSGGITVLSDGAYVVRSQVWNNASIAGAGAATYGAADTGVGGVVSAANSLVGSSAFDQVGMGVTALSDGAYVVNSSFWDNGGIADVGAATYGVAGAGISGVISAANSLVGSSAGDRVGANFALGDGAYVVVSSSWDGASFADAGAVTYGAAGIALTGTINASNSLVGSRPNDRVGSQGITVLSDGAYVVPSRYWNNSLGAVTYGTAGIGINGDVSSLNSLVGSSFGDQVGSGGVTALVGGAYTVSSPLWNNAGLADAGAVTYGAAGTALIGTISASNSLVGGAAFDQAGSGGVTALVDGSYVVRSPNWDNAGVFDGGAATYGAAGTALVGTISASNSLVGTQASDQVGSLVFSLSDGAYVVSSYFWDNGYIVNAGAATYGAAGAALTGAVTVDNSLVGASSGDQLGGVFALSDGAYMVLCANCDYAGLADVGAVTYGSASFGVTGVVGISNSLVGSQANDRVGSGGITALSGGAYVVVSPSWDSGSLVDAGAVTYGAAGTALTGTIDSSNSLVGSTAGDQLGLYDGAPSILALGDGSYVVRSHLWDNSGVANVGAVTYGAAGIALAGTIDSSNSLLGSVAGDLLGDRGLVQLSDGRVLVRSPNQAVNGIKTGRISLVDFDPALGDLTFADSPSADFSINPDRIAEILNGGTSLTLQASNDITLASALLVDNASGNGGHLTLQAGRHINFNANLTTDNGDLTAIAGDPNALAVHAEAGTPTLTIANGVTLDIGTGTATLAAIDGNFVNNAGSGAIQISGAGRYLIYSSDPAASLEGLSGYGKHYNQGFALGSVPAYASSGNWFFYSIAPVLSITPDASSQVYGELNLAGLGYGLSGLIDGDDAASSGLTGGALFTSTATAGSDVGRYDLAYASGLASSLGYSFADAAASTNELSITQRAISLSADAASKVYGEVDPDLGVSVSAGSLAAGDSLAEVSGSLSRELGENVGVYDLALGSGLKAGNYTISFDADNNAISITPRQLVVTANDAERYQGEANPAFSATFSGWAFDDDQQDLQGELAFTTPATTASAVGDYGVSPSGLSADNYVLEFNDGTLRVLAQEPVEQPDPGTGNVSGVEAAQQQVASVISSQLLTSRGDEQQVNDLAEMLAQGSERWAGDDRVPAQAALSDGSAGGGVLLSTLGNLLSRNQGLRLPTFNTEEEL
ncbi:hypothetical protein PSEUDO9AZ_40202 [Pseudomonas sp. 9AZ]|uniref:two-partner secretion domain-containing protein n=1 Tax=Pseudomonas sp. 9AZ TaxID=2653168 RepID=UPI0012EF8D8F|nr:MBG domain-containing protein [Pseudomonas sp. 9AZ]VXD00295.1 hypothetical protein PSEUDO9AZ_40202 [Pseudomonas sp. 9AZ]